jgi:hypothetical protein
MAVIIIGGSGRNVGKTALVCSLIGALPEYRFTAVKISNHDHGHPEPVWEETGSGEDTDTGRYMAAGAQRALLVTALDGDFPVKQIQAAVANDADVIFESNRILQYYKADLCLAVLGDPLAEKKPSFDQFAQRADAFVARTGEDAKSFNLPRDAIVLPLVDFEAMPPELITWLRKRLRFSKPDPL